MNETTTQVAIIGGGLAGAALALQLKRTLPNIDITIIERKTLPYPEATHKVGESTVEVAAHYFSKVLGLQEHLQKEQLRKLGIRLFFTCGKNERIEERLEMGSNRHFFVPTYQIDRGRFENHIIAKLQEHGVTFVSEAKVTSVTLSDSGEHHTISYTARDDSHTLRCRWAIDASGRAGLFKRQLGLQQPSEHDSNAAWFRVKGRVDIDDWHSDPSWKEGHDGTFSRWYSTNHLTGRGYWVWLIPLASGYTSIGVVTDPKIHPLSNFRSFDETLGWMRTFEPQCAQELEKFSDSIADYLAIKHYAHKCDRVLSGDRWAITGDAGVFIDPLYSPGSDFIGIQNTFITDLIQRDLASQRFIGRCEAYNDIYHELTESFLATFHRQYPVFGNPRVMPLKVIWDYTIYWGFLAFVAIQERFCDFESLKVIKDAVSRVYTLGEEMQELLRVHNETSTAPVERGFLDIAHIPFILELNRSLTLPHTDATFISTLQSNIGIIEDAFACIRAILESPTPLWNTHGELVELLRAVTPPQAKAA